MGIKQLQLLKSKSTETTRWNTPTSITKEWNIQKQMSQPWDMCIWTTTPLMQQRLILLDYKWCVRSNVENAYDIAA